MGSVLHKPSKRGRLYPGISSSSKLGRMYILNKIAFSGINFSPSTNVKTQQDKQSMEDTLKVLLLIRSFQTNGYLKANLDPLKLDISQKNDQLIRIYQNLTTLDYKTYGFTEEDLDREFMIYTDKITVIS